MNLNLIVMEKDNKSHSKNKTFSDDTSKTPHPKESKIKSATEKLDELNSALKELKLKSTDLIVTMLPIMQEITEKDSDIVDEISYTTKAEKKEIITWLEKRMMHMTEDAEKVIKEIDVFTENLLKGQKELEKNSEEYPFLAEVWYGDIYNGKDEKEALLLLTKDINKYLKDANEDSIIKSGVKYFAK